jgi:hypothetical protein
MSEKVTKYERYRRNREAQGETQVQIWLRHDLREKVDALVRAGNYKNRSELFAKVMAEFVEGRNLEGQQM